jgi:hypothetical protein
MWPLLLQIADTLARVLTLPAALLLLAFLVSEIVR